MDGVIFLALGRASKGASNHVSELNEDVLAGINNPRVAHDRHSLSGLLQFPAEIVLGHLPEDLTPALEVAYITGWRIKSELLARQRHHVDLRAGWLRLEPGETKNREGRMFPPTETLRAILERQLATTHALEKATGQIIPWLFHRNGEPIKSYRRAWLTACKKAGLPGKIPHDFRRTAVRNLERAGVPRSAAMKMVGHRTESVYRRYAIADEGMLREAAAKLETLHAAERDTRPVVVAIAGPAGRASSRILGKSGDGEAGL